MVWCWNVDMIWDLIVLLLFGFILLLYVRLLFFLLLFIHDRFMIDWLIGRFPKCEWIVRVQTAVDFGKLLSTLISPNGRRRTFEASVTRFIPITSRRFVGDRISGTARFIYRSFPLEPPNSIPVTHHKDEILKCKNIIPTLRSLIVFGRRNRCCSRCSLHLLDP